MFLKAESCMNYNRTTVFFASTSTETAIVM